MTAVSAPLAPPDALAQIHAAARAAGLSYAGDVPPDLAHALLEAGQALLIDVRSPEEIRFVGHVPGAVNVPWASGLALTRNPRFLRALETAAPREAVILLLCRSGQRSVLAAQAATAAGFAQVFNVLEGFEGDLDAAGQRGRVSGWRRRDLPWRQD
ncbi:rhodanese-like domain-containing protein [Rhodobacter capsulatus]|uniref:Rhodanese-like domain-containing protein n=1 Tax=Rhodobacter capsulatus TaxID=1061 RepID=A0A4U1JRP3_RHOCA|nr:rhodanese-like domain-containing protein [Rhodobacter capsulatus]TKD21694.1 rhodanese-like domain-containing protein [Rhodobacter capsulatus]